MSERRKSLLADYTTFRIGGAAKTFITATTEAEIIAAVSAADDQGEPLLILSGGSNMLVSDAGFAGTVVHIASRGIDAEASPCAGAVVTVQAGEVWDDFVEFAVVKCWAGIEALSGIPGLVGAAPVQNIGAYGQEVAGVIAQIRTWDRKLRTVRTFSVSECEFGYRDSRFKRAVLGADGSGRYVVLAVQFQFERSTLGFPIRYAELANALGVEVGTRVDAAEVRAAVLVLRAAKGMVATADDHDSWSAGSFFTNPIIPATLADTLPLDAPRFPQPDGNIKTSAAWLIDHAGFPKGFGLPNSPAGLSTKHVLALTNRGNAKAADVLALARAIRDGVRTTYGITLTPEPLLVSLTLD
ncbi:MAG: UDP-N-acetylmuramate dehydrogenase [Propionibacteriaceae bacterium]|jgi:UDP-N-acetylmuramate dehydrogenase|nr:UDP-N-acetylmuramate dehydrogenase [Propionibacteriaceae bacterium]